MAKQSNNDLLELTEEPDYVNIQQPVQNNSEPIYENIQQSVQNNSEPIYENIQQSVQNNSEPIYESIRNSKHHSISTQAEDPPYVNITQDTENSPLYVNTGFQMKEDPPYVNI